MHDHDIFMLVINVCIGLLEGNSFRLTPIWQFLTANISTIKMQVMIRGHNLWDCELN